jgi:hypothetical protein
LAAVGFFLMSLGNVGAGALPALGRYSHAVQAVGPVLIAIAMLVAWRSNAGRLGRTACVFFVIGALGFAAIFLPYAIDLSHLGDDASHQLGYITGGIAWLCIAVGTFLVMRRKEVQLTHPVYSVAPQIKSSFMQILLVGLGAMLFGIDLIWVGEEDANQQQFSLIIVSVLLIFISVIAARRHLSRQWGRPAFVVVCLAILIYCDDFVLHALPVAVDGEWRLSFEIQALAYGLAGVACILVSAHRSKAVTAGVYVS